MNLKGEVVGVAAAYLKKSENLNFAIPLERILVLTRIKPVTLKIWSNPSQKPSEYDLFSEGLASMKLDDCQQGLVSFALALKKKPTFAWAWWGFGVCLLDRGDSDKAIVAFKQATAIDPNIGAAHYDLGLIYADQGRRTPAYEQYELLKRIDPDLATKL
jgi:tetratricopeptide (TPR) repeat protein